MPIEVSRFGVGHRRPVGAPWTEGVSGRVIHSDVRGVVTEFAFERGARIAPHSSPSTSYLIVIEGGGWVAVGAERVRVAAGEAVVWPAGVAHGAWTEHSEMRAFLVEFAAGEETPGAVLEPPRPALRAGDAPPPRGEGRLAPPERDPDAVDRSSGEPL